MPGKSCAVEGFVPEIAFVTLVVVVAVATRTKPRTRLKHTVFTLKAAAKVRSPVKCARKHWRCGVFVCWAASRRAVLPVFLMRRSSRNAPFAHRKPKSNWLNWLGSYSRSSTRMTSCWRTLTSQRIMFKSRLCLTPSLSWKTN
jgi:hypothetical protein